MELPWPLLWISAKTILNWKNLNEIGRQYSDGQYRKIQGGSNMTGTDLCVNKPHCAAAVRP